MLSPQSSRVRATALGSAITSLLEVLLPLILTAAGRL